MLKTVETLHNQKDYQGALRLLEGQKEKISPGLWHYNMGTELGKLENLPLARYHLLMSELNGYSSRELSQNKNLIETKLDISRWEKPLSAVDYLVKGSMFASEGIFTLLSLLLIIAGIITVIKNKSLKVFAATLILACIFLGLNFWVKSWERVIVVESQTIQEGPSAIFGSTGELPLGTLLVVRHEGEWLKVIYPSRFTGWIKWSGLKELK